MANNQINLLQCDANDFVEVNGVKYYKEVKQKTGYERETPNSHYYFVNKNGESNQETDNYINYDNLVFGSANYYNDENLAANIAKLELLTRKIRRWQALNDRPVVIDDWTDYWSICFTKNECKVLTTEGKAFNEILFTTKERAEKCLEEFKDELEWVLKKFKPRLDM